MKTTRCLALMVALALMVTPWNALRAEDTPSGKSPAAKEKEVFDFYKYCVCDIETRCVLDTSNSRMEIPERFDIFYLATNPVSGAKFLATMPAWRVSSKEIAFGGTGFFVDNEGVDNEGMVATVAHVVKEEGDAIKTFGGSLKIIDYQYTITILDKPAEGATPPATEKRRKYRAELLGHDGQRDTAVLRIKDISPKSYNAAKICPDPDKLLESTGVHALGAPLGLTNSWTSGRISALHRIVGMWYLEDFIQTDCPINPGNSGSPLINDAGEVVALNDLTVRNASNLSFSISVKLLQLERLKKGSAKPPWFGCEALLEDFPRASSAEHLDIDDLVFLSKETGMTNVDSLVTLCKMVKDRWAIVNMVETMVASDGKTNSPAKTAGLQRGDLVTHVAGKAVRGGMEIRLAVADMPVGQEFEIGYIRVDANGVAHEDKAKVTLVEKNK